MNRIIGTNRFGLNFVNRLTRDTSSSISKPFNCSFVRFGCNVGDYGNSDRNNTFRDAWTKYRKASVKHDLITQIKDNENQLTKLVQNPMSLNLSLSYVFVSIPSIYGTYFTMMGYINQGMSILYPYSFGTLSLCTFGYSVYYFKSAFDKTNVKNALIKDKMLLNVLTNNGYYTTIKTSEHMNTK